MQMLQHSRSARSRLRAVRLGGVATAGVLAATLVLAAPARAADPAVQTEAGVESAFVVDPACSITSGGDLNDTTAKTVATKGTKKVDIEATGTVKAEDGVDPTDQVTMKATNHLTGSITGVGGAFSKAAFTLNQTGSIAMAKSLGTNCDPEIGMQTGVGVGLTIKKTGTLALRVDLPRDTIAQIQIIKDGGPQVVAVAYDARGTYVMSRKATPGAYVVQLTSIVALGFNGSQILLDHAGKVGLSMKYAKS